MAFKIPKIKRVIPSSAMSQLEEEALQASLEKGIRPKNLTKSISNSEKQALVDEAEQLSKQIETEDLLAKQAAEQSKYQNITNPIEVTNPELLNQSKTLMGEGFSAKPGPNLNPNFTIKTPGSQVPQVIEQPQRGLILGKYSQDQIPSSLRDVTPRALTKTDDVIETISRKAPEQVNEKDILLLEDAVKSGNVDTTKLQKIKDLLKSPSVKKLLIASGIGAGVVGGLNLASRDPEHQVEARVPSTPQLKPVSQTPAEIAAIESDVESNPVVRTAKPSGQPKTATPTAETSPIPLEQYIQDPNVLKFLNIDAKELGTVDKLQEAQNVRNKTKDLADWSKIGSMVGHAIRGGDPTKNPYLSMYDEYAKEGDVRLQQYKDRVEQQKTDPNSPISQAFKEYAKNLGYDIKGDFSAASAEKIVPMLFKGFEAEETRKSKEEQNALTRQAQADLTKYRYDSLAQEKALKREDKQKEHEQKQDKQKNDWLDKQVKETEKIVTSQSSMENAANYANNATGTPAEQISILYKYIKGMDPDSAVREGEVGLARSITSLSGKAEMLYNSVLTGATIDQKTFDALKKEIIKFKEEHNNTYGRIMGRRQKLAERRNLGKEFNEIINPFSTNSSTMDPNKRQELIDKIKQNRGK